MVENIIVTLIVIAWNAYLIYKMYKDDQTNS